MAPVASGGVAHRGSSRQFSRQETFVVACKYWYELTDGFWGQFALSQLPHASVQALLPKLLYLEPQLNFAGMLEYLDGWRWWDPHTVKASDAVHFAVSALPLLPDHHGGLRPLGEYDQGGSVFPSMRDAFEYLLDLAKANLQYRGMRDDRLTCFDYKQQANYLLHERVGGCEDPFEYERLRQEWTHINRPRHFNPTWSIDQLEVLKRIEEALAIDDEEARRESCRFLYVEGEPGSGKSAVMLEAAIRAAKAGVVVSIVCPNRHACACFQGQAARNRWYRKHSN